MKKSKKILLVGTSFTVIAVLIFYTVFTMQYKSYREKANIVFYELIDKIVEKYPEVKEEEIIEILNSKEVKKDILKKYGYTKDSEILKEAESEKSKFLKIDISLICIIGAIIICIILIKNKKEEEKIADISEYLRKINAGDYKLKIEENGEDELTKLRNEIYKITVLLRENAENSQKEKEQLSISLADISHQIKTPLTSIRIMLDNIQENPEMDLKTKNEFMEDISKQIDWISSLVIVLLKLAKFDAGSIKMCDKEINIKELVQKVLSNLAILIDIKSIQIKEGIPEKSTLYADYNWQIEALTNIIKNCIEHSKDGGKILIKAEDNSVFTKIIIQDEGEGIGKKDLKHIFERFYKAEKSSENSIGIGLSLAKTIIEKERGYIKVKSEVGKGTTFEIKYLKWENIVRIFSKLY